MAILNDIEVRIASRTTGKVLKEYEKPYTVPSAKKLFIEKFVEAETGLEFHVEVFVNSNFQYYQASGILFGVHIDGDRVATYRYTSKELLRQQVIDREPTVIDDVPHKEGDRSCRIKFNFGSLGINEELDLEKEVLDKQADALGSIKVSVVRATVTKRSEPLLVSSQYQPSITADVAKEIVKDQHVSHSMEPGEKTLIEAPEPFTHDSLRIPGTNGRSFNFVFRYRSQMNLELLGCIPRSLTPVPIEKKWPDELTEIEKIQELTRLRANVLAMEASEKEKVEEIERLTAENAGMKELKDKMTAFRTLMGGMAAGFSTPTPPPVGIKRERIKEEDSAEGSGRSPTTRNRPTKWTKAVDLTAD